MNKEPVRVRSSVDGDIVYLSERFRIDKTTSFTSYLSYYLDMNPARGGITSSCTGETGEVGILPLHWELVW